jgi:hypothetical protein
LIEIDAITDRPPIGLTGGALLTKVCLCPGQNEQLALRAGAPLLRCKLELVEGTHPIARPTNPNCFEQGALLGRLGNALFRRCFDQGDCTIQLRARVRFREDRHPGGEACLRA